MNRRRPDFPANPTREHTLASVHPRPVRIAHNPKVAGSNPAPATR